MRNGPYLVLAVALSTLAAGIVGLLVVWYPTDTPPAGTMLPSWTGSTQKWAGVAVIKFLPMVLAAFLSYSVARNHPTAVIFTALAGVLLMGTLALIEPNCIQREAWRRG